MNFNSMKWKQAVIYADANIKDAIKNLEVTAAQIVLVCDINDTLVGVITDGDIRRGIMLGKKLEDSVAEIMNKAPVTLSGDLGNNIVRSQMESLGLRQIPKIDEFGKLVGLYLLNENTEVKALENLMVIMAGGLGIRMLPLTENTPKPMLLVEGKPILLHIIERAKSQGFRKFVISVGYLSEKIVEFFGDGSKWEIEISYLYEDSPLGTAGALSNLRISNNLPIVVSNGDVLSNIDYSLLLNFHHQEKSDATIVTKLVQWSARYGVVNVRNQRIVEYMEKPTYNLSVNAGIYVFETSLLNFLEAGKRCDMNIFLNNLIEKDCYIAAYPLYEKWIDIGVIENLEVLNGKEANDKR